MNTSAFNIVGKRRIWYILSAFLIVPGLISLFVWGLNYGIDFRGGTVQEVVYEADRPHVEDVRSRIGETNAKGVTVQTSGEKGMLFRFPNQEGVSPRDTGNAILEALRKDDIVLTEQRFESIGESVARATVVKAIWAVVLTSLAIILFIAFSFRGVRQPASSWRFGTTAVLALAHDLLFVIGAFSVLGHFFPSVEVDALFVTALLTILGFSVNDTIVVFDRIRENLRRMPGASFEELSNVSLNQTIARSINTSTTVLIVLLCLLVIGGQPIRNFILALTLGVVIGTYSSIFNATPLLVSWQNLVERRTKK